MLKEGIIKVGEDEREVVEKALLMGEILNKNDDSDNCEENYNEAIKNFISFAKENGFNGSMSNDKDEIIADIVYSRWNDLFINV